MIAFSLGIQMLLEMFSECAALYSLIIWYTLYNIYVDIKLDSGSIATCVLNRPCNLNALRILLFKTLFDAMNRRGCTAEFNVPMNKVIRRTTTSLPSYFPANMRILSTLHGNHNTAKVTTIRMQRYAALTSLLTDIFTDSLRKPLQATFDKALNFCVASWRC